MHNILPHVHCVLWIYTVAVSCPGMYMYVGLVHVCTYLCTVLLVFFGVGGGHFLWIWKILRVRGNFFVVACTHALMGVDH